MSSESEVKTLNKISFEALRKNIKGLRVKAGYTQVQAAEELELTKETIYRWEKEPQKMPIVKLAVLANLYNCSVNDFFAE